MPVKGRKKARSDISTDVATEEEKKKMMPPKARRKASLSSSSEDNVAIAGLKRAWSGVSKDSADCLSNGAPAAGSPLGRSRRSRAVKVDYLTEMRAVVSKLHDMVIDARLETEATKGFLAQAAKVEDVMIQTMGEISKLKGQLMVYQSSAETTMGRNIVAAPAVNAAAAAAPTAAAATVTAAIRKPVETWSAVLKHGDPAVTSEEIVRTFMTKVGPTVGDVRIHDVKPIKKGGAVIRTRSRGERAKIVANKKLEEVGLKVTVNDKLGPRLVVRGVHCNITADEFMQELYDKNLKEMMTVEEFKKSVRLVGGAWKTGDGSNNVVLEGSEKAMGYIKDVGRIYIKWFSFPVRLQNEVQHCYRCLGFDHRIRDCRMKQSVCRVCSKEGHESRQCQNLPFCRNCAFKGLPADHSLVSSTCPLYAAMVARANARH